MAVCLIRGVIHGLDDTPVPEAQVRACVRLTEQDQSGQLAGQSGIASDPVVVFTDATGQFSIGLVQGAVVLLEIPAINLRRFITVPADAGPVDFTTLV